MSTSRFWTRKRVHYLTEIVGPPLIGVLVLVQLAATFTVIAMEHHTLMPLYAALACAVSATITLIGGAHFLDYIYNKFNTDDCPGTPPTSPAED